MTKLARLFVVAGFAAVALGANLPLTASADEFVARYSYLINGVEAPRSAAYSQTLTNSATVLNAPAVIERTVTAPAVVTTESTVVGKPIMIEHHESKVPHIFHLGLWPLVDFSIF